MYCIEIVIKNKCICDGFDLFRHAEFLYGMTYNFETKEFEKLIKNLFDIYEYHNEIYKYNNDIHTSLEHAIAVNIESGKKILTLEDIRDSIWSVKTDRDKDNCKVVSTTLYKIKKRREDMACQKKI